MKYRRMSNGKPSLVCTKSNADPEEKARNPVQGEPLEYYPIATQETTP